MKPRLTTLDEYYLMQNEINKIMKDLRVIKNLQIGAKLNINVCQVMTACLEAVRDEIDVFLSINFNKYR